MSDKPSGTLHERHFSVAEANALLPRLTDLLERLRGARDELTDGEAHELLAESGPTNGGGVPGRQVGVAFLEVRRLLAAIEDAGSSCETSSAAWWTFRADRGPRGLPLLGARRERGRVLA